MPMRFFVAPELPRGLDSISLSYTLFDVTAACSRRTDRDRGLSSKVLLEQPRHGDTRSR